MWILRMETNEIEALITNWKGWEPQSQLGENQEAKEIVIQFLLAQ